MKNKIISLALAVIMLLSVFALVGCKENEPECDHSRLSAYKFNATEHWKVCANKNCTSTEKFKKAEHDFDEYDICVDCGYEKGTEVVVYPWNNAEIKF
jgi:hypothetical protein